MCGSHSAIGLTEVDRKLWPQIRERLREPRHLMGLMRGVLDGAIEVAAVIAVTPDGIVRPLALVATPILAADVQLDDGSAGEIRPARIGDDKIDVLVGSAADRAAVQPLAILLTPWITEHLALYARTLW
jgi:hypothetical protein